MYSRSRGDRMFAWAYGWKGASLSSVRFGEGAFTSVS